MALKSFAPIPAPSSISIPAERLFQARDSVREDFEDVIPFSHYVWLIRSHWWKLVLFIAFCCLCAYVIASRITPTYESTARLIIDLKTSSNVIGQSVTGSTSGGEADQLFNTQLQLIQSDAVLRPVAERFKLLPEKGQRRLPGGMAAAEAPVYLSGLKVVHPANSFLIDITYRSQDPLQAAALANAVAHSYISRQMEMRVHASMEESSFMSTQLGELKETMDKSASALAGYERQLGLVNPEEKTSIIAARLMQLNTEYTESQNDRIRKEADYRAFQSGSLAAIQISPQASALSRMEDTVRSTEQKMEAVKTIYGSSNTEYKRAANELVEVNRQYSGMKAEIGKRIEVEYQESLTREHMLQASLLQAKSESDALNAHSMEYQELRREAEANKSLYSELFRKVREAGINGAFQGSAVRIADEARPQPTPAFPNRGVFVLIAFLCSFGLALVAILLMDVLDSSLRDPRQVRRELESDVLGVLPQVESTEWLMPLDFDSEPVALARWKSNKWFATRNFYTEAIETLLTSVFDNQHHRPLYSVMITSANPGEGKSSCIAHMASAYARQGYRTLLIDADLRRPSLQTLFNLKAGSGLTHGILSGAPLRDIRQQVENLPNLHIVTAGASGKRLYNQVSKTVNRLLVEGRGEYDVVFIDAPPMLCFAEPLQLATMVDGVLVVNLAGVTSRTVASDLLSTLRRVRANHLGIILNRVKYDMSATYEPYRRYYQASRELAAIV